MDFQLFPINFVHPVRPEKAQKNEDCRDGLGHNRRDGDPCDAHVENDDEDQVEYHVDNSCNKQEKERALGVSKGAQDGCAEVIEHIGRHPDEIDAHIERRLVENVFRSPHQGEHRLRQENADKNQDGPRD